MEVDALAVAVHADGRGVADEVDVVTSSGKFLAEFGGNDAGAAVGGVAGYANAHGAEVVSVGRIVSLRYYRMKASKAERWLAGLRTRVLKSRTRIE